MSRRKVPAAVFAAVSTLFFLSGAAGLVYQVLWMRRLGLFLGSDLFSVSIILSAFMGGLALGSIAGGWLSERTPRPLAWYGIAELGIGAFALCFSQILLLFDPILAAVYPADPADGTGLYQLVRAALATASLLVPTALMGTTLPLIVRHFTRSDAAVGRMAGTFYALNTLGAVTGTVVAGFVLLPYLGLDRATLCVASLNALIGATCVVLGRRSVRPDGTSMEAERQPTPAPGAAGPSQRRRLERATLWAFGLSGLGSFALEVTWTRILVVSVSATVYSFAAMLCCFLFGIFLGSLLVSRSIDRHPDPVALLVRLELGAGASVASLALVAQFVPPLFGTVFAALATVLGPTGFVLSTLLTSFLLLVIPTTLIGATFPVALRVYSRSAARVGSRTGLLYAANTAGAIAGSLGAGLVLIPALGTRATLAGVACLFAAIGLGLASAAADRGVAGWRQPRIAWPALAILGAALASLAIPYRPTLNFNQKRDVETELVFHREGVRSNIDVVRSRSGVMSLVIDGNVEADDSLVQRRHFVLKGHLPLLFLDEPRSVLVIGLGMGITLQSSANHPGVERIDVIELSPEILAAQSVLADSNGDVIHHPNVHVRIDDGRSYVARSDERYDMITADPIHPRVTGAGYLYTREYYESIRAKLTDGGIVCQWMPLYQISPTRLRSAVRTFAEVFPHATFWYVENHALFLAKDGPLDIDYARLAERFRQPTVRDDLDSIGIDSPEDLLSLLLMGPAEIRAFTGDPPEVPLNTDDHPYLEYFVPADLFWRVSANIRELSRHAADPLGLVSDWPTEAKARLETLAQQRRAEMARH